MTPHLLAVIAVNTSTRAKPVAHKILRAHGITPPLRPHRAGDSPPKTGESEIEFAKCLVNSRRELVGRGCTQIPMDLAC